MLRFLVIFIASVGIVLCTLTLVVWLSLETRPSVTISSIPHLNQSENIDTLLNQLKEATTPNQQPLSLVIKQSQVESLQGLLQRTSKKLRADMFIRESGTVLSLTAQLKYKNFMRYLNIHIWITEGDGLPLQKMKIGKLTLSGRTARALLASSVNYLTQSELGDVFFNCVETVSMHAGQAGIQLRSLTPLITEYNKSTVHIPFKQTKQRQTYTKQLLTALEKYDLRTGDSSQSLNAYLRFVFEKAAELGEEHDQYNAVIVNEAAILSLALYFNPLPFSLFVEKLDDLNHISIPAVTLADRNDYALHFITGAALAIVSHKNIAKAISEYNELVDRATSRNGYNFADLAASYSGVRFANEATNPAKAWLVQQRLIAGVDEHAYFPNVKNLDAALHKSEFTAKFSRIDSKAYKAKMNQIKGKINRLYLYSI
jgi:hypothetical protein